MHRPKDLIHILRLKTTTVLTGQCPLFQLLQELSGLVNKDFYHWFMFCHRASLPLSDYP